MNCVNCGIENSDDSYFCKNCGSKLEKSLPIEISEVNNDYNIEDTQPIPKVNPKKIPKIHMDFKPKKKMIILVLISLIVFVSITAFSFSDSGTKYRLKYYGNSKNEGKLISYINKNKKNNDKSDLVLYGIHQIILNNIEEGVSYLEEEIYNKENDINIISYIISEMNKYKISPEDSNRFCGYYINEYILNQSTETTTVLNNSNDSTVDNNRYWDSVLNLIKMYPNDQVENSFYDNISNLYIDKKLNESVSVLIACNTLKIGNNEKNKKLKGLIENLIENNSKMKSATNDIENIVTQIEKIKSDIENGNELLNNATNESAKLNDAIKNLKNQLAIKKNYLNLRFYCLKEHDKSIYEIILPKKSILFGEILSSTHAILYTTNSKLSPKTWVNINVYNQGNQAMVLKGYGNIKQEIAIYKEVSKSDYSKIDELNNEINDKNTLLVELNKTIENLKTTIKEMQNIINEQEIEKSNHLNEIEILTKTNDNNDLDVKKLLSIDYKKRD